VTVTAVDGRSHECGDASTNDNENGNGVVCEAATEVRRPRNRRLPVCPPAVTSLRGFCGTLESVSETSSTLERSVTGFRRRSPLLFFSSIALLTAVLVAGGLVLLAPGHGGPPRPPLSVVTTEALRYFNGSFHVGSHAHQYRAHCQVTATTGTTTSYSCHVVRAPRVTTNVTTVYVTETPLGTGQNFTATYGFVPQ